MHSTLDTAQSAILDTIPNSQAPWYNDTTIFAGAGASANRTHLSDADTPYDGPPLASRNPPLPLTSISLEFDFILFVCAQTKDDPSVFAEEASANWKFIGDGTIDNHVYTKTPNVAQVVPPVSWNTSVTAGASPKITSPLFNVLLRGSGDVLAKERFK